MRAIRRQSVDKSFAVKDGDFATAKGSKKTRFLVCVAVAVKREGVAVRDSKDSSKKTLFFTPAEWACFIEGVKNGEFDPVGGVEANLPRL